MGNSQTKGQAKNRQKKQVRWKAAERPQPPGKPQLVPGAEVTPDVVKIKWDKPNSDGGAPIIGYLVEHRRTGSPHWVRATPLLVNVPELTLSGLEPGWRYQFRVTAQNPVGMSDPGESSEPLTVTLQRSVITAPKFTEELKDTTAMENEMTEFAVHVIGQPAPKVCWFKDGFEIFSSRRTRIITENDKSVLTIHQVALTDEGEIKCTATNKAGHASTKAIIKVEAPPIIRLPRQYEDGLLFELDEIIRLKVSIAGRPQPLVFWSHNGETIQNDDRYEIINTDRSSVIRIGEAKRSDRGEYQIRAVNQLGEDHTSFLVTVTDKPRPPAHLKVIMSLGKTVTLSWELPEDDGGCKIGNYIVEYYRIGWNVWLKALTCRQLTTTLSDLIEGSEYKFRVKAESPYGVSDPSDETDVLFIPDPKRGMLAPPPRSRSQPRNAVREIIPIPPKRRSASSTRHGEREQINTLIPATAPPIPPKRERIKTPHRSPESSPEIKRRDFSNSAINQTIFDRSSLAREITYGTDIKYKKADARPQPVIQKEQELINESKKSPLSIKRERSPSRINQFLSNILTKKSSSPSPSSDNSPKDSPSPSKTNNSPNNTPSPVSEQEDIINSLKGDHLDRLSPIIINRRSSSPMIYDRSRSPSPMNVTRNRSPSVAENMIHLSPAVRSRSPSPNPSFNEGSPNSRRNSVNNGNSLRRESIQSYGNNNNDDMVHGSSEFMLVILEDHDAANQNYFMFDDNLIAPPMSLSAPELGADSQLFAPLKSSVSSTELLHERAFARFAKEAEEWNRGITPDRISLGRRESLEKTRKLEIKAVDDKLPNIPKILINSEEKEDTTDLERKPSFVRRLSAGVTHMAQQYVWAKRRNSLRNNTENTEFRDVKSKYSDKLKDMVVPERSHSEEKEEAEFAKVREKSTNNDSNIRRDLLKENNETQESLHKINNENEKEHESFSEEESESESDDERFKLDLAPPHIEVQEEETYHPRMLVQPTISKHDEPFEILTKPSPLPDPNFVPKPILKKTEPPAGKKPVPEKPVRKFLSNEPNRDLLSPNNAASRSRTPSPSRGEVNQRQPSPIRNIPEAQMISAAEAAKNKRMLNRQSSEEEYKVVADHYGDIVRTYSQPKKFQPPTISRDELKTTTEPDDYLTSEESLHMLHHKKETPPIRTTSLRDKHETSRSATKRVPSPCPVRRPVVPENAVNKTNKRIRSRSNSRTRGETRRAITPSDLQNRFNTISRTPTPRSMTPRSMTPRSMTPSSRPQTPEQEALQAEAEIIVRTTMEYITDVAMFIVACWLYLFKDARLAIPILIIMVYRQLKDEVKKMLPAWMTKSKKP